MTEEEIITTFQQNRHIANTQGWPRFFAGFIAFAAALLTVGPPATHWLGLVLIVASWAAMINGLMIVTSRLRCPACNAPVRSTSHGRGFLLDPASCPKCGARLK